MVPVLALAEVHKVPQGALHLNGVVDLQALQIAGHPAALHPNDRSSVLVHQNWPCHLMTARSTCS